MELIKSFSQLGKSDAAIAGGKGASLGEMTQAGIPVPQGFVVLSGAFERFIEETDLVQEIDAVLATVDPHTMHTVEHASEKIQALILGANMPDDLRSSILQNYKTLDAEFVAVRSSATAEDSASAAWAGQLDSYLNTTEGELLKNVQRCWASLFTPRAIFYRFEKELHLTKISVAVVVQKMVHSEVSGIAFSVHPVTEDRNQLIIEAGFGLGEAIVSGQVTPDSYVVEKSPRKIIDVNVSTQTRALYRAAGGGNEWRDIAGDVASSQVLNEPQILELSDLIVKIENHYGFPCDIEWAFEAGKFYIVQSRPITTLSAVPTPISDSLINRLKKAVGEDEYIVIRGKYAALFVTTWILKNGDFPLYMASSADASVIIGDEDLYKDYARRVFAAYVQGEFTISAFKEKYAAYVANLTAQYQSAMQLDIAACSDAELAERVGKAQTIFDELTSDTLFIEFLVPEVISDVLKGSRFAAIDARHVLEQAAAMPFDSFEHRHRALKIKALHAAGGVVTSQLIRDVKYLFTDYQCTKPDAAIRAELEALQGALPPMVEEASAPTLSQDEQYLFDYFVYISRLRDYRKDHLAMAQALLQLFGEELCRRVGLLPHDALNMLPTELMQGVAYIREHKDDIVARRGGLEAYSISRDNTNIHASTIDVGALAKEFSHQHDTHTNEIKGDGASRGVARGRVRIVYDAMRENEFIDGEVLVTSMTRPEFVPLMKRAGAIVTNEGGITCHAAIVSRELKKPCVIGTRIATEFLKTGDMVEVDAEKGIVRILER